MKVQSNLVSMATSLPPTIGPAVSLKVHLGLTVSFTILYGLLFLLILWQLLLILYYKHRRLSYQTIFLFSCLIWAALRTTLFSFYFNNCGLSNALGPFMHWMLFAFPVYLQYNMLSVLVFYFFLVVIKVVSPKKLSKKRQKSLIAIFVSNFIFLGTNIASSIYYGVNPSSEYQQTITILRVVIDYTLFLIAALVLCYCIIKMTRINSAKMFLEGQGVSFCQAIAVCAIIALLYITRAIYNILAVSPIVIPTFGYGWVNVSDQGEAGLDGIIKHTTKNFAFISFGIILFVWELIPTFTTVWFFRVRRPDGRLTSSSVTSESHHGRRYFFDNPNKYDSDDDLSIAYTPPRSNFMQSSLPDIPNFGSSHQGSVNNEQSSFRKIVRSYGSVPPIGTTSYNSKGSYASPQVKGTTPPLLYSGQAQESTSLPFVQSDN